MDKCFLLKVNADEGLILLGVFTSFDKVKASTHQNENTLICIETVMDDPLARPLSVMTKDPGGEWLKDMDNMVNKLNA